MLARDQTLRTQAEFDVLPNIVLLSILLKEDDFLVECHALQPLSDAFYDYVKTKSRQALEKLMGHFEANHIPKNGH